MFARRGAHASRSRRARAALLSVSAALLAALAWLLPAAARAQDVLPVPALSGRVIDHSGTLDAAQRQAMEQHLATVERDLGSQIVVLLVPTTQPEDIAAYAQRVADQWKIGRRQVGDGVLIVVAKNDRRVRIEVAKALEGAIPDLAARQIISETISPAFKRNDFAGGLNAAIDRLAGRIKPEGLPLPDSRRSESLLGSDFSWEELAIFFFVAVPIIGAVLTGIFGRKLGSMLTGGAAGGVAWALTTSLLLAGAAAFVALFLVGVMGFGAAGRRRGNLGGHGGGPPIIWGGGGSGWGGGDGGGGFSSGGGGDFGGGGASGDW